MEELSAAAYAGKVQELMRLVAIGTPLNTPVPGDDPPIISAAMAGHTRALQLFIENGADVNIQAEGGMTSLMQALFLF